MSVKNIQEIIKDIESDILKPEVIKDNKIIFFCDDNVYRVRMPNQLETLKAIQKRNEYEVMLLNEENTLTLKQLKKVLKGKGVDIGAMEKELLVLENKMLHVYERLAPRPDTDVEGIKSDKETIQKIKDERNEIIDEISKRISPSIDIQAENYYMSYLTSICTEKNVELEDKPVWEAEWKSFNEYLQTEDSDLKFYGMGYLSQLMMKAK